MEYKIKLTPFFETQLKKLKKKPAKINDFRGPKIMKIILRDKVLFDRLIQKLKEIKQNPEHYKPLKNILKGNRRAHLGVFIIIFDIYEDLITVHYVKHHDDAY